MKNLYVGNLPHSTTESELRTVFEAHGAVEKISIVTDRETGRSRGFAFVEMTNAGEADKAVADAVRNQPDVRAFAKLFPASEHFITHYTGTAGPKPQILLESTMTYPDDEDH